jgi:hypothetical protein
VAEHASEEVNPNQMDAAVVVANCSWVLAELLRYAQKGAAELSQAVDLLAALTPKRFPAIENIDGRVSFTLKALVPVKFVYSHCGVTIRELIEAARRHGASPSNAKFRMGVSRLRQTVDNDGFSPRSLRLLLAAWLC